MGDLTEDLKRLNARIDDIDRAIGRERTIIEELETLRDGGGSHEVRANLERNRRKLRDLEYEGRSIRERKGDLEDIYNRERLEKLNAELAELEHRRGAVTESLIPLLEEKIERLRDEVEDIDRRIMRINGKIKFINEQ